MKKISLKLEIDAYTEKAVRKYCRDAGITMEKFMEEAVFEKLEAGDLGGEFVGVDEIDDSRFDAGTPENTLFESEEDLYKKKH